MLKLGFYGGLAIKGVFAVIEFIGGLVFAITSHASIERFIQLITFEELQNDPNDLVMNYIIRFGQTISISSQHTVAIYLLLHGGIKLILIGLLWNRKLWAFPLSLVVFGLFITYESYHCILHFSIPLLLLILVDIVMMIVIALEYRQLKTSVQ